MKLRPLVKITAILLVSVLSTKAFAQQSEAATISNRTQAAEVEQAIRNFYKAFGQGDHQSIAGFIIDESFAYDAGFHVYSGKVGKARLFYAMDEMKAAQHVTFDVSDFTFAFVNSDVAVANYRLESKSLTDPNDTTSDQITDTLVRRNGRWQIFAEHSSSNPKPLEPIIKGLPIGWRRNPGGNADRYTFGVDTLIKHSGNASASLKRTCGDDEDSFASLGQPIAADDYRGKRIRLTGWLKTADAGYAGLWMRVDADRNVLAFDNMENRFVKGTTEWKLYAVVLDVPANAKNIWIGVLLTGKGQTWADDFKLGVVDDSVASTNSNSTDEMKEDRPDLLKYPKQNNKYPMNLGFEGGIVH